MEKLYDMTELCNILKKHRFFIEYVIEKSNIAPDDFNKKGQKMFVESKAKEIIKLCNQYATTMQVYGVSMEDKEAKKNLRIRENILSALDIKPLVFGGQRYFNQEETKKLRNYLGLEGRYVRTREKQAEEDFILLKDLCLLKSLNYRVFAKKVRDKEGQIFDTSNKRYIRVKISDIAKIEKANLFKGKNTNYDEVIALLETNKNQNIEG